MDKLKIKLNKLGERISENGLIVFDYRSVLLLIFATIAFSGLVAFKIHYSSINRWNDLIRGNDVKDESLLAGAPKGIRGDEWNVVTPFILSQANQSPRFPVVNESLGGGQTPLLMSLPVSHFSTLFRPQNWGFFLFDLEKAYSFYWNFKVFGLFFGFFLLLMLLTRNNFWLSVFGSIWLFFSSFVQWWFSTPAMLPEMIASFSLATIGFSYLLLAEKRTSFLLGAGLAVVFSINFVLFFYPPFQIPLAYLGIFTLAGLFFHKNGLEKIRKFLKLRIILLLLALGVIGTALYFFYIDAKIGISLVQNTVYPGERSFKSGGLPAVRLFSGFYDLYFNEDNFPAKLENICEASNFILLFPIVFLVFLEKFFRKRKISRLQLAILGYLLLLTIWAIVGFPAAINRISLLKLISPTRAFVGFGVASILSTVILLSEKKESVLNGDKRKTFFRTAIYFGIVFLFALWLGSAFNAAYDNYLKNWQLMAIGLWLTAITSFIINGKKMMASLLILAAVIPFHYDVNPVVTGLNSIYGKNVVQFARKINEKDKEAKWLVMGKFSDIYSNLMKTSGAQVINGVNFIPNFKILGELDLESKNAEIYNRYAHIEYFPSKAGTDAAFDLKQTDKYSVTIDPCSDKLKKIGIKYLVLKGKTDNLNLDCLELLTEKPLNQTNVYKYR